MSTTADRYYPSCIFLIKWVLLAYSDSSAAPGFLRLYRHEYHVLVLVGNTTRPASKIPRSYCPNNPSESARTTQKREGREGQHDHSQNRCDD